MEAFFTFVFAPCVPFIMPQSTSMVTLTSVLLRFECSLFEHVVPLVLSVLLWTHHFLLTPSLLFVQRAAAFLLLLYFIDPHTCFSMFSCLLGEFFTLESCPFILPRFPNFKQVFLTICLCAARLSFLQFRCFRKSTFEHVVWLCCTHTLIFHTFVKVLIPQQHPPAAFYHSGRPRNIAHCLDPHCQVIVFLCIEWLISRYCIS